MADSSMHNAYRHKRAAQRNIPATHQQQYQAAVFFNVWPEHIQPPIISSPLRRCPHCPRLFDSPQALGGHQNAHKRERAAASGPNFPANNLQEYRLLPLFPANPQQQPTSSIPFPHFPGMCHPVGAAVLVEKWLEPIQPQPHQQHQDQNLASSSVPRSFLGVSTADAFSTTTDVDDSTNMDLTLRL